MEDHLSAHTSEKDCLVNIQHKSSGEPSSTLTSRVTENVCNTLVQKVGNFESTGNRNILNENISNAEWPLETKSSTEGQSPVLGSTNIGMSNLPIAKNVTPNYEDTNNLLVLGGTQDPSDPAFIQCDTSQPETGSYLNNPLKTNYTEGSISEMQKPDQFELQKTVEAIVTEDVTVHSDVSNVSPGKRNLQQSQQKEKHRRVHPTFEEVKPSTNLQNMIFEMNILIQADSAKVKVQSDNSKVIENDKISCELDCFPTIPLSTDSEINQIPPSNMNGCQPYCDIDFHGVAEISPDVVESFANRVTPNVIKQRPTTPISTHLDNSNTSLDDKQMSNEPRIAEIRLENVKIQRDENGHPTMSIFTKNSLGSADTSKTITLNATIKGSDTFPKDFTDTINPFINSLLGASSINFFSGNIVNTSPDAAKSNQCKSGQHLNFSKTCANNFQGQAIEQNPNSDFANEFVFQLPINVAQIGENGKPKDTNSEISVAFKPVPNLLDVEVDGGRPTPTPGKWTCFPLRRKKAAHE